MKKRLPRDDGVLSLREFPMDDNVRIMCPNLTCRRILAVPTSARGKTVRCRNCGTNIRVPGVGENLKDIQRPDPSKKPAA